MSTRVFIVAALWLLAGCTLEVAPDYARPFVGQIDAASGQWWLPDALDAETVDVDWPFGIVSVTPSTGAPEGGDKVVVQGHDFRQTDRVFFGDVESSEVRFQGPDRLVAYTPPHASGLVPVLVRHQEGDEVQAPRAFLFTREPTLLAVEPAVAPAEGGQPVTLRFASLDPDALVLVASRLLVSPVRTGDVVTGVLPPLDDGDNDVLVVTPGKVWRFDGVLTSSRAPEVLHAEPMAVTVGGGEAALVGHGLAGARVYVDGQPAAVTRTRADGTLLGLIVPAGEPGPVRIEVLADAGVAVAEGAVVRASTDVALAGVYPGHGDAAGGTVLALALTGLDPAEVDRATVCGADAPVVGRPEGTLLVAAPAVTPGPCDVQVEAGDAVLVRPQAYVADAVTFRVEVLEPATGPAAGGTHVRLSGAFPGGLDGATLCGLPLTDLAPDGATAYTAVTPAGSPGDCPLRLVAGGRDLASAASFRYVHGQTRLLAVTDDQGSRAGRTLVRVIGTDLPTTARVLFDQADLAVEHAAPNALLCRTPAVDGPRVVDVTLTDGARASTLPQGYEYLDLATESAGTWGGRIRDTVNVAVLHSSTRAPVPDAHVALRLDDGSYLRSRTDAKGQTVFSRPGLRGPVDVTASSIAYSAYTIAGFDARNVTLALRGPVPPPTGGDGTDTENPFQPASVMGTVVGADKHVPPAYRACEGALDDGTCAPCAVDADCPESLRCLAVGATGNACLAACDDGADAACPERFACLPVGADDERCFPVLGQRRIFCFPSADGSGGYPVTVDQGALVSTDDAFLLSGVRLGEIAVLCLAGYEDDLTHDFVPQTLGAARHLFTVSDTLLDGVEVVLDTPLGESPPFELTGWVSEPGAFPAVSAWITLDLGSDGTLALPGWATPLDERHVVFPEVPLSFQGTFYDASFDLQVHAGMGGASYAPYAEVYRFGLEGFRQDRTYSFEQGKPVAHSLSLPVNFTALATDSDGEVLAATDDGRVLRQRWGTWYAEPVAGRAVLRSLAAVGADVVGVGDAGALVRRAEGQWSLPAPVTDRDLHGVALDGHGGLVAVGDLRLAQGPLSAPEVLKIPDALRSVAVDGDEAWAVGLGGVAYHRAADGAWRRVALNGAGDLLAVAFFAGEAYAGGREGRVWRLKADGAAEPVGDLGAAVASLAAAPDGLVAGLQGGVSAWNGQAWSTTALAPDFRVTGVALAAGVPVAAVGTMNLGLGPIFPPVTFLRPERKGAWSGRVLSWQFPGGAPGGDYQMLSLYDYFGDLVWTLLTDAAPTSYALPPLDAWGEYDPLDRPALRLQYGRVLAPGFDLDQTNGYAGGYLSREAVLYDYFEFLRR